MQSFTTLVSLAALAAPLVSAHGYIATVVANGQTYSDVGQPNWYYTQSQGKPQRAGWFAMNQDNGFVEPNSFGTNDIACHKSATAGSTEIAVTAGSTVKVTWNTWPDTHHGPVIDYLAKCSGSCTSASAGDLSFFKIQQTGLIDGSVLPGKWASDSLISAGFSWNIKIPASIAPGSYVLRHEIIALHSAGSPNGAQAYPSCINLKISGSGSTSPAGTKGSSLYKATDPGILFNLYQSPLKYTIPGPSSVVSKRDAVPFKA